MLDSGFRVSEVARLEVEDVVIEGGRLFLRVKEGKGKKEKVGSSCG